MLRSKCRRFFWLTPAVLWMTFMATNSSRASVLLINATVRDFSVNHSDFEPNIAGHRTGLVSSTLPASQNPVFVAPAGAGGISSASSFMQWYTDTPGVNLATNVVLPLAETTAGSGIFEYGNSAFFPIDGQLFGNEGYSHNYHFTLELHATFTYHPGQTFTFVGDDDVWVYINNQLVIDLGGVHNALSGGVNLDTLGLNPGSTYGFDLFFAERHTTDSFFQFQTGIVLNTSVPGPDPNPNPNPSPVPEPGTAIMFGLGTATMLRRRWRSRIRQASRDTQHQGIHSSGMSVSGATEGSSSSNLTVFLKTLPKAGLR